MRKESVHKLVELVRKRRPDLLIITDDVYGTFVNGFRSLAADLPRNTLLVYSYSKHFGCTGWRHGVVLLHGSGFDGPPWSARVSLANLEDDAYSRIGRELMTEAPSPCTRGG